MAFSVDLLQSVAATGSASVTIPLTNTDQIITFKVDANYAAAAATSGVSLQVQTSVDGTTFVNSNAATVTTPNGTGLKEAYITYRNGNDPFRLDRAALNSVKLLISNTDATNAATVCVSHETRNYIK